MQINLVAPSSEASRLLYEFFKTIPINGIGARHAYLIDLVRRVAPKRILELGVWAGDGAELLIRQALSRGNPVEYWGIDLFLESVPDTPEMERIEVCAIDNVARRLEGLDAPVTLFRGLTSNVLRDVRLPKMDLVYIDAGHSYAEVRTDFDSCSQLLRPGGVIVFDDYTDLETARRESYGVTRLVGELVSLN
jgi:predicted O-methyltransferase YrrM